MFVTALLLLTAGLVYPRERAVTSAEQLADLGLKSCGGLLTAVTLGLRQNAGTINEMKLLPLLVLSLLLACSNGMPQDGKKDSDTRVGIDRPSTEPAPEVSQENLDNLLCEVFNTCGDSSNPQPGPAPAPIPTQSYFPSSTPSPPAPTLPDHQVEEGCQCVQYYLCNDNNTINSDGVGLIDIRIKDEGCVDYLEKCCGAEHIVPEPPTPKPQIDTQQKCGTRNPEGIGFRITGNNDNEAQYAEFPWMVAVVRPNPTASGNSKSVNVYQCGGSLIHPQVVLTAAHCVNGKDNLIIRAGEWDTQTKNEQYPTQDRNVRQVIIHEQFNKGTLHNDPALLILDQPVDMSLPNVGLICLPEANENMDNRNCVASGWGKDSFGKEGNYQVILKRVDLPMVTRAKCVEALHRTRLGPGFKLHESFVCAGGIRGRDTCKGDGGSPLVCPSKYNPSMYVQAGIVAWGIDCGTETPGVYVNVPLFVNWIYNKLQAQGISLDS